MPEGWWEMQTVRGITYHMYGEGPEAVLCHPSLGLGQFLFHRIRPALSREYTVVLWDPRGVGDNGHFYPTLEDWVGDTIDILRDINKPAHLLGVSLGTWVMSRVAAVNPGQLVRSLTLIGATRGFSHGEQEIAARRQQLEHMTMREFAQNYADNTLTVYALPEVKENLVLEMGEVDKEKYLQAMQAIYTVRNEEVYRQIAVPTLVMVGVEDTRTPPAEADEVQKLIKGSEVKALPRCGHLAVLDQPQRVIHECRYFWTNGHMADD